MKSNSIIFPCLRDNISFLKGAPMGFSVGIYSIKVSPSEIIYTFPRPLGRRRKNGAKHHPKMVSAKFEIKFTLNHIYIYKALHLIIDIFFRKEI